MLDNNILENMLSDAVADFNKKSYSYNSHPTLVILGGQPGSGKSRALESIEQQFKMDIRVLNADVVKEYYPKYHELLA